MIGTSYSVMAGWLSSKSMGCTVVTGSLNGNADPSAGLHRMRAIASTAARSSLASLDDCSIAAYSTSPDSPTFNLTMARPAARSAIASFGYTGFASVHSSSSPTGGAWRSVAQAVPVTAMAIAAHRQLPFMSVAPSSYGTAEASAARHQEGTG
nr:hypothetical protein [Cupriavidus malaysiensis]